MIVADREGPGHVNDVTRGGDSTTRRICDVLV